MKILNNGVYLLLIDEEAEIKENTNTFKEGFNGDWFWNSKYNSIQRIGDITEFDFKIIAYYPLTKEAEELDLPLLPSFEVDIEKLACEKYNLKEGINDYDERYFNSHNVARAEAFIEGYKATQQAKQFSLEDIEKTMEFCIKIGLNKISEIPYYKNTLLQSLSTQQLPNEFIPEYQLIKKECECFATSFKGCSQCLEKQLKTITNSEGKEELVGVWRSNKN